MTPLSDITYIYLYVFYSFYLLGAIWRRSFLNHFYKLILFIKIILLLYLLILFLFIYILNK